MWPVLFWLGDYPLRTFGPLVAIGFLIGVWWGTRLSRRYGADPQLDPQRASDVAWWILIGVIAGGRLAYVLVNAREFLDHPLSVFAIWEGGMVMYGGLILAIVLGAWKARQLGMDLWRTADYGLTAGFLGQAIGRWGCLAVGDDYGAPTTVPWALRVPAELPEGSLFDPNLAGCTIHPTQIYMSLKALALFLLGSWMLRRCWKFKGQIFCTLLAGYAVLRFFIEFFRFDAEARSGIFKAGASPMEVNVRLHELGLADQFGRIIDVARYRQLLCQGTEGVAPELLLSTSQLLSMVMLPLALLLYFVLARRPQNRF